MAVRAHVYIDPELIEKAKIALGLDKGTANTVVVRQALIDASGDTTMTAIIPVGRPPKNRKDG